MQIVKTNVIHQVVEYIKKNIENRSWQVGERIPSENMLTRTLGVSRASVRVAIQQFVGVGALQSVHGKGTFVKSNVLDAFANKANSITREDCKDMRKVLEFRRILETEGCQLAARNATSDVMEKLELHLGNMINSVGNAEVFVREDILFHESIAKASGNHLLEKSLKEVFDETIRTHAQVNEVFGYKDGIYYHSVILKAIREKNPKLARRLMHEHLQQAIDRLGVEE